MLPPPPPSPRPSTDASAQQQQQWGSSRTTSVTESSMTTKRTRHFTYRQSTLQPNGVFIDRQGIKAPQDVMTFARHVLKRRRNSLPPTDAEVMSIRGDFAELADDNEDDAAIVLKKFFPESKSARLSAPRSVYSGQVVCGNGLFHLGPLPVGKNAPFRIAAPKTDVNYGYAEETFSPEERAILQHNVISPYAHPSGEGFMPFFAVDFKAQSRQGTFWVAENQCAGFGAHRMNSVTHLFQRVQRAVQTEDVVMFSCTMDCNSAVFWVHWREMNSNGDTPWHYRSAQALHLDLINSDDVRQLPQTIRNILDFGLGDRLTKIRELARHLIPLKPQLDQEEKEMKTRSAPDDEDGQSEGSTRQRAPKRRSSRA